MFSNYLYYTPFEKNKQAKSERVFDFLLEITDLIEKMLHFRSLIENTDEKQSLQSGRPQLPYEIVQREIRSPHPVGIPGSRQFQLVGFC